MTNQLFIEAASVCVFRGRQVLLVQRANALGRGLWSLPGGKLEPGEAAVEAAMRELLEETNITSQVVGQVGLYEINAGTVHYKISCFAAWHEKGEPQASSDASDARFVAVEDIDTYALAPNTREAVLAARLLMSV